MAGSSNCCKALGQGHGEDPEGGLAGVVGGGRGHQDAGVRAGGMGGLLGARAIPVIDIIVGSPYVLAFTLALWVYAGMWALPLLRTWRLGLGPWRGMLFTIGD